MFVDQPINHSSSCAGLPASELVTQGLYPGMRVFVDDDTAHPATLCSIAKCGRSALISFDGAADRTRVDTWRIASAA